MGGFSGNEFISKNPSTAAGSYMHGGMAGNGYNAAMRSGGGIGQQFAESFDLDIMMPPDVASIDSDLSNFYMSLQFEFR